MAYDTSRRWTSARAGALGFRPRTPVRGRRRRARRERRSRAHPPRVNAGSSAAGPARLRRDIRRHQVLARTQRSWSAIEDLADLGVIRGWSGNAQVAIAELRIEDQKITAANGTVTLAGLRSGKFGGADIGGYELALSQESVQPDGTAIAQVRDLGGPLQLTGSLNIVPAQSLLTFSGALMERAGLPPALHQELENLAQMRGRDPQGRVPLEIEFAF